MALQFGHDITVGAFKASCDRRILRTEREVFFLGVGMATLPSN